MAVAPPFFRRLAEGPLEVRAVGMWRENAASVAFYNRPSPVGSRPGIYYVNLADMTQVLKPQIEAISYHEGAPGHHFQSALAQELPNVPKFRRFGGYGAYGEGWGLYSESPDEHTPELQSLMGTPNAVFRLKKQNNSDQHHWNTDHK